MPEVANMVRAIAGIDCTACQLSTRILRAINKLGEERAIELITRLIEAKRTNNRAAVAQINKEYEAS